MSTLGPRESTLSPPASGPTRTSGLAVASLILGLLGFLILPAVAGFVCGLVAFGRIRRSNGALGGTGLAVAGMVTSAVTFALAAVLAIGAAIMLPALARAKQRAQIITSMNNVKQLCLGAILYAGDHDERWPDAAQWCDAISPTIGSPQVFRRPNDPAQSRCGYGYNALVSGLKTPDVNPRTVIFFELASPGWNISGGPELIRQEPGGGQGIVIGFADGHVEAVTSSRITQLRWEP